MTDKTDRCNASPEKTEIMKPVVSTYKASTIAYKMLFGDFPKDRWVTFRLNVIWTTYDKEKIYFVNNKEILIGRNDEEGYYFKFGIYRVGNSTIPVCYNLTNYTEHINSKDQR